MKFAIYIVFAWIFIYIQIIKSEILGSYNVSHVLWKIFEFNINVQNLTHNTFWNGLKQKKIVRKICLAFGLP